MSRIIHIEADPFLRFDMDDSLLGILVIHYKLPLPRNRKGGKTIRLDCLPTCHPLQEWTILYKVLLILVEDQIIQLLFCQSPKLLQLEQEEDGAEHHPCTKRDV